MSSHPGLITRVRRLLDAGLHIAQIRLKLLTIELQEEKLRIISLLFSTLFAVLAIGFGLVFFAVFLTVLFWDEHRLLALGMASFFFIGAGLIAVLNAVRQLHKGSQLFSATLAELSDDRKALGRVDERTGI